MTQNETYFSLEIIKLFKTKVVCKKKYLHLLKLGFRHTTEKSGEKCYKRKNEKYDTRLFDSG